MQPRGAQGDDWPQWGGPQRDLVWRESGIVDALPNSENGVLPRVWTTPIAEGYSGPAVAGEKTFVTDFVRQSGNAGVERLLCIDTDTGDILWKHEYEARYSISYPHGPRATPLVDGDRVYSLGAMGNLFCIDVDSSEVLWEADYEEDFQARIPTWGTAASPLIVGDQLIALVGGVDALVVSFDKMSGAVRWKALSDRQVGYSPPVVFEFGGREQLICWHPAAVTSLDPLTGDANWSVPYNVRSGLTIATPRRIGNRIFVTSFYNGPMMIEVSGDGRSARVAWRGTSESEIETDGLHSIMPTPYVDADHIFGVCSYGQLRCLNTTTGERMWETFAATGQGRWWNAFVVPHEDRFFIHNEQGDLIIAELSGDGYKELSRAKLIEPTREVRRRMTIWSHPAFAQQSVFARNDKELVRVSLASE